MDLRYHGTRTRASPDQRSNALISSEQAHSSDERDRATLPAANAGEAGLTFRRSQAVLHAFAFWRSSSGGGASNCAMASERPKQRAGDAPIESNEFSSVDVDVLSRASKAIE